MFHFGTELMALTHYIAMSVPIIKDLLTFNPRIAVAWLKLVFGFAQRGERLDRIGAA